jgi:hypothetical protein
MNRHFILLPRFAIFAAFFFIACATVEAPPPLTLEEQIIQDREDVSSILKKLERTLKLRKAPATEVYLSALCRSILGADSANAEMPCRVRVFRESNEIPRFFGLPGVELFVGDRFLKQVTTEAEIAAAISLQVEVVLKRVLMLRVKDWNIDQEDESNVVDVPVLGPESVFMIDRQLGEDVIPLAAGRLVAAQYDPRALSRLFTMHHAASGDSERYLVATARYVQSEFLPIRNPILKSNAFLTTQKIWQGW